MSEEPSVSLCLCVEAFASRDPPKPRIECAERGTTLRRDHLRRIVAVAHARRKGFVQLTDLAELDPATAFRGRIGFGRRGLPRAQKQAGFDFAAANFRGCDLRGAGLSLTKGVSAATLAEAITDAATCPPPPSTQFSATGRAILGRGLGP